ncbi:CCA tRNA nucleotidyltransferase [Paramylibacter ulvae]|nr:CCA tRNA nucleotidyltransferase [Amylibacter ulvae]
MTLLTGAGYEAYFVGGCVRNALLNEPASDIDISTNAHPDAVVKIATAAGIKSIPTGIDHGTVTIVIGGDAYEITTFRKDIATDGRRAIVAYADNIIDDARRRDFTMNAIYADQSGKVTDPLNGLPDLLARHVRFIDGPDQRIAEDYLRILRFFRFTAWYGDINNGIDAEGLAACARGLDGLQNLSRERVGGEVSKLLSAPNPAPAVAAMAQSGVLAQTIKGAQHQFLAPLIHLEQQFDVAPNWIARLVCLTRDAQDLRLSRKDENQRINLIKLLDNNPPPHAAAYRYGATLAYSAALILAASLESVPPKKLRENIALANEVVFPIKSTDLSDQLQGKSLGNALRKLERRWIQSRFTMTKQELLNEL